MSRSPSTPLDVQVAMKTDIGRKRKQNQDAIGHYMPPDPELAAQLGQVFVLADGVGGLSGGDLASQYAVSTIISSYYEQEEGEPPERLARAIAEANNLIFAESQGQERPTIMATTVVAAVLRDDELIVGSVGDSPAYLMRDADVRQLTIDRTAEVLERDSAATPEKADPAARKLARALGSLPSVKVDIISGRVRPGDHLVLCSDGLTRYVSPREIEQTVATVAPEKAVDALIELANERGGADNVSLIVLRLGVLEDAGIPVVAEAVASAPAIAPADDPPDERPPSPPGPPAIAPRREQFAEDSPADDPPADTPWRVLLDIAAGNALVSAALMTVLLIAFVAVLLGLSGLGGGPAPTPTVDTAGMTREAATAAAFAAATRQADAQATQTVVQATEAAQLATVAVLTLTPPPNSGPELETGMWFTVVEGDDIPAFEDASVDADEATALVAGSNYRVSDIDRQATNGYWYFVVDNLGQETRWVNGPSLHQRVLVVDESGNPLPDDQQPLDLPPGAPTPTPPAPPETADATDDATDEAESTSTPGTPTASPEATEAAIPYDVEGWQNGDTVFIRQNLDLCETPSVTTCSVGIATAGEQGVIVEGPIASGEHWWWQVEFPDGRSGWIAQPLLGLT